jgi:hypothetical protein
MERFAAGVFKKVIQDQQVRLIAARQTLTCLARRLLAAAALLTTTVAMSEEALWQLQQQDDGINIYSRSVDGSSYLAIEATVLINAPITHVAKFLGNGNGCAKWRSKCKSSEVLETVSEHERYVHVVLDLPWPATDRDIVLHSKTDIDSDAKAATVNLQSVSSRQPLGDYVRAETSGQFVVRAVSETQVEFTYIMHTELGGNLPAGRVNADLADGAYKDLSRLRQLAEG